jgi:hypothetical protein
MFRRILRTVMTLAAIIVAYQVYVLLAVPRLEPPLELRQAGHASDDGRQQAEQSITRYQRLLANYFPPDHWSLTQPPKVIESGPVMFVLDDYKRQEDGRVDLTKCALVIFPTPRVDGTEPPRDAIILEAPQGAKLQFDEHFQPARGQLGQITRGEFPGPITIRSDMHAAGPEDDLLVETSDLEMNTKLLYTTHDVRFRLGPNEGSGRELEIRLLEEEGASSKTGGLKIAGVDSLELRRNVRLRVYLETDSLLPGNEKPRTDAKATAQSNKPPVEVTCTGPFHFDFIRYVAGFDQNVELWQVNPDGPSDHLSCQQLDIHFAPKPQSIEERKTATFDPSRRQQQDLGRLEPDKVVAQGHPVIVVSPSRGAEARGARVQLALRERKVTIDGGSDAVLVYGSNYLRAPLVEYQHPAPDSTTKIGRFRAEGTGSLHYLPDPTKPEQILEAKWQGGVKLGRYNGQPVLTISGRPQLAVTGAGRLVADKMQVYLRELETDGTRQPAVALPGQAALGSKLQVVPDHMSALGHVQIESPQLVGSMQELHGVFRIEPERSDAAAAGTTGTADRGLASRFGPAQAGQENQKVYHLDTDRLNLEIALRGQRAVPTRATCEGNVAFRELPTGANDEGLLEVRGGQLTLDDLDTAAQVTIVGAAPGEPAGARPAEIKARGMTMLTAAVQLDAGENRLWSDGPGKATMLVTRDLEGNASSTPTPLELQWEDGLNFDGRFITFNRRVLVQGAEDWLRCDQLAAKLTAPIVFGHSATGQALDLAEIQCTGHVAMDHRTRDATGPTSHERVELGQLTINQQTGAITGQGPGTIRSTHYSAQLNPLANPKLAGAKAGPSGAPAAAGLAPGGGAKLHFFRVDFQRGLAGNLYVREMKLEERVRVVYGPVDSWEQELNINRPETLSPSTVTLTCDALRVNEDPVAATLRRAKDPYKVSSRAMGPVQLRAEGNVRIDGESPSQGVFAAQAHRATYEQAKETFILEGTPSVPATLWHRPRSGGQMAQNSARKITYHRLSGEFKIEDIRSFDFTPPAAPASAPQNARGPAPQPVPVR